MRRSSAVETTGDLAYRLFMAIYWVVLSRSLPVAVVGTLAFANSVAVPISVVVDSGFSQYLVREYATAGSVGLPRSLHRAVTRRYAIVAATAAVVALAVYVLGSTSGRFWIGLFIGVSYSFDAVGLIWLTRVRANLNAEAYAVVRVVQSLGVVVCTIGLWFTGPYNGVSVSALSAGVYAIGAVIALGVWSRGVRWQTANESTLPAARPRRQFAAFAVLTTAYSRLDAIVVQLVLGPVGLAVYTLAFKLVEATRVLPGAISRSLLAAASGAADSAEHDHRVLPRSLFSTVRLCIVAGLFLLVTGPELMGLLFGRLYAYHAVTTLRLLSATLPGIGLTGPLAGLLLAWGHESLAAKNSAVTLLVTALTAVGLALIAGLPGVAAGVLLGEIVSVAQYMLALRRLGFRTDHLRSNDFVLVILICAGVATVVVLPPFSIVAAALGMILAVVGTITTVRGHSRVLQEAACA